MIKHPDTPEPLNLPPLPSGYKWEKAIPDDILPGARTVANLALEMCKASGGEITLKALQSTLPDALTLLVDAAKIMHVAKIEDQTHEGFNGLVAGNVPRLSVEEIERARSMRHITGLDILNARSGKECPDRKQTGFKPITEGQMREYLVLLGKVVGRGWKGPSSGSSQEISEREQLLWDAGWGTVKPVPRPGNGKKLTGSGIPSLGDGFIAGKLDGFPQGVEDAVFKFRLEWVESQRSRKAQLPEVGFRRSLAAWLRDTCRNSWPGLALNAMRDNAEIPPGLFAKLLQIQEEGLEKYAEKFEVE